jgi:hypothetical protein
MRAVPILIAVLVLAPLGGCRQKTQGDAVRQVYDNKADAIEAQAEQQPTPVAKKIYKSQADAIREEGEDRKKGLEGRTPSKGQDGGATAGGVNTQAGDLPR